MLTNCEIIWRDGIPEDTIMMTVPRTSLWLECKKWLNGTWRVTLMDPMGTYRKEVWRSIPENELERIFNQLCKADSLSHKTGKKLLAEIRKLRTLIQADFRP